MSLPRQVLPGHFYLITWRCTQRQFLLRPDHETNNAFTWASFALKQQLRDVFPGRFTTSEPAAVELHATYSGFSDEVCTVQLAPDKEAERQFLPAAATSSCFRARSSR